MVEFQCHRVKGQGYIRPQPIDLILFERNAAVDTASAIPLPQSSCFPIGKSSNSQTAKRKLKFHLKCEHQDEFRDLSMLHVRSKQVSAIAEISVDFKYPISHDISSIIEKGQGDFFQQNTAF